jgi:hypothetical protein
MNLWFDMQVVPVLGYGAEESEMVTRGDGRSRLERLRDLSQKLEHKVGSRMRWNRLELWGKRSEK